MTILTHHQTHLLSHARIGHLATASETGVPHVVPVCFAVHEGLVYSVLDLKPKRTALMRLRRIKNIQANPRVSLVVDHYEEDWTQLWYILVSGRAELLIEGEERASAVPVLRAKYPQYRGMDIDQNPVIRISPERVVEWPVPSS